MSLQSEILELGRRAKAASRVLSQLTTAEKNTILLGMADGIVAASDTILAANAKDIAAAETRGLSAAMLDRLRLDPKRILKIAGDIRDVANLPDPVGGVINKWTQPNGIEISKIRVPIGVIGIIYESRPNVTSDAAVLCLKAGNATLLRGGSESIHSNIAIAAALQAGGATAGLPADSIVLIPKTDREGVKHMCALDQYVDVIVPRGGHALIEAVVTHARMPVIKHYNGICHIYVDKDADLGMATQITLNAKCQRPGVCNAAETLLVHRDVAQAFLTTGGKALLDAGVELRGGDDVKAILGKAVCAVAEADWSEEYLALILSIKIVDNIEEAITHIENFGSHHSDAIVTTNESTAEKFLNEVDSATVYWNASTRFTDGAEFGFGAEIGISTDKLHARGPMALEELTTYKYTIRGNGQVK